MTDKKRKVKTFFASTQHGAIRAFQNLDGEVTSPGKNFKICAISDSIIPTKFVQLTHQGIKPETFIARAVIFEIYES